MPEQYYSHLDEFRKVKNEAAKRHYFKDTEPFFEEPTHQRILHTGKAVTLAQAMIAQIVTDVVVNSRKAWKPGTPLHGKENKLQPLADGSQEFALAFLVNVPEFDWIITEADVIEVEEQLKKLERWEKANQARIVVKGTSIRWSPQIGAEAMTAALAITAVQSLVATDMKTTKRRRTMLCSSLCLSILGAIETQIGEIMNKRALETTDTVKRTWKKFKSRKS